MNEDSSSSLHPALATARYGRNHDGDRFVGFWLELMVEARQGSLRAVTMRTRRLLTRFWSGKDVQAALAAVGDGPFNDQLRDAAEVYFVSCLTDPQYSSGM
ncbi:MAG: hypothetical protein Q4P15_05645, partial [Propionibacteriaceae bacterium]|nr:hypothetical protein [Propionibacteriaceae bacterium]